MFSFWYYLAWLPLPLGWCPTGPELTSHCKLHICSNSNFFKKPSENLKRRYIWYDALAGSCLKFPGQKYMCLVYMCLIIFIFAFIFVFDMKTIIIIINIIITIIIIWKSKFLQTGRGRGSEGQTNWQQRTGKDLVEITIQIQIMMSKKIWHTQNLKVK